MDKHCIIFLSIVHMTLYPTRTHVPNPYSYALMISGKISLGCKYSIAKEVVFCLSLPNRMLLCQR